MSIGNTEIGTLSWFWLVNWGQLGISNVTTHHNSLSFSRIEGGVNLEDYFEVGRRMDESDMAFR